jgi:hypothetical protein
MMFGHLKPEDFVNLIEGDELPAHRRSHLDGCARCSTKWTSMLAMHAKVTSLDADIPEPDWMEFRSAVRDRLLSRSVQRASAVRRWTGWSLRPAAAWALSVFAAVALTTGAFVWNTGKTSSPGGVLQSLPVQPALESDDAEMVKTVWSQTALFDELIQLGDAEEEQLRQMLESAQKGAPYRQ